jgi:hypothetical protein
VPHSKEVSEFMRDEEWLKRGFDPLCRRETQKAFVATKIPKV